MSRRLVITGASGFIGRALVEAAVEQGWSVEAWSRRSPPLDALGTDSQSVTWRQVDLSDDGMTQLQPAGETPFAIVHAAALAHSRPSPEMAARVEAVNVEGTRRVLELASRWGVDRCVLISSVLAESEDDALYGGAKRRAEQAVEQWAASSSDRFGVALRFPLVYGPGVRANFGRLVSLARRGLALRISALQSGDPHSRDRAARRSLLARPNAVSAILATLDALDLSDSAAARLAPGFHRFTVTDAEPYSLWQIGQTLCRAAHLGAVPVYLPRTPLRWLARLGDRAERRWGRTLPWSSQVMDKLDTDAIYDGEPFCAATGWRPHTTLDQLAPRILAYDEKEIG